MPPALLAPEPSPAQRVRPLAIIRDVVIIWGLICIGGIVVGIGFGSLDPETQLLVDAGSSVATIAIGFTISGCLAPPGRWRHLAYVAIGAWLVSFINVVFFGFSIPQWIMSAFKWAICMGLGGTISYILKK